MSAYYRFPEFKLASGRYILIEIFTQDVSSGIAAPYLDSGGRIDLTMNPWLQEGIPLAKQIAQPALGMIGTDACEFAFYGGALYSGKCLYCLIMEQPPDQYVWNIRYYTKPNAAASYPLRPAFWGIIDRAEPDGELKNMTRHELNKYKLAAVNRFALLERVAITDWPIPWKTTLAIAPAHTFIDGEHLHLLYFSDGVTEYRVDSDNMRFLNIKAMLNTIASAVALTTDVNYLDTILSSWVFYGKNGSGVETAYTFNDLVIASGTDIGGTWYWHWSYFDHEKNGDYSIYAVETLLQVFKQILAPFGLTAFIDVWHSTGESYLAVREVESRAGVVLRMLLRDKQLSPGEGSSKGVVVNIANDTELAIESTDGESIDLCFQSATRIRAGERWIHETPQGSGFQDHDTDDLVCLYSSLYIYDAAGNYVTNVTKIDVKNDGRDYVQVSPYSVSLTSGGKMIAEAVARFWFNPQNHTVSQLGYYRREMQQLEIRDFEIRDDIAGSTTNFITGKLVCTAKFPGDNDTYLYRRVRNQVTGAEALVTNRDDANTLAIDVDIFPSGTGVAFVVLGPRVGDFAELPDGNRWAIRELAVNDREGTTDFLLEAESYL